MASVRDTEIAVHSETVRLSDPELVDSLVELLGAKLVAYLGGVKETRAVRQWSSGEREFRSDLIRQRLQVAYQAARLISDAETPPIAQAWFVGMNPSLDDISPARALCDDDLDTASRHVMAAARQFVVAG